jgi:hypothetical protein
LSRQQQLPPAGLAHAHERGRQFRNNQLVGRGSASQVLRRLIFSAREQSGR